MDITCEQRGQKNPELIISRISQSPHPFSHRRVITAPLQKRQALLQLVPSAGGGALAGYSMTPVPSPSLPPLSPIPSLLFLVQIHSTWTVCILYHPKCVSGRQGSLTLVLFLDFSSSQLPPSRQPSVVSMETRLHLNVCILPYLQVLDLSLELSHSQKQNAGEQTES